MKLPTFVFLAALCGGVAGIACADDPKRPPIESDSPVSPGNSTIGGGAGRSDASTDPSDGGDAGSTCTALEGSETIVDQNAVTADLPLGTGGVVLDGTYDLVEAQLYQSAGVPGSTDTTFQGSIRIASPAFERVMIVTVAAGTAVETRAAGTFSSSGTNAAIVLSCPSSTQEQLTYTVLDNFLTLSNLTTKESFRFEKRP